MNSKNRHSSSGSVLLRVLLLILALVGAFLVYALSVYEEPPVDPLWAVSGSEHIPAGAVTVRYQRHGDPVVQRRRNAVDDRRLVHPPRPAAPAGG